MFLILEFHFLVTQRICLKDYLFLLLLLLYPNYLLCLNLCTLLQTIQNLSFFLKCNYRLLLALFIEDITLFDKFCRVWLVRFDKVEFVVFCRFLMSFAEVFAVEGVTHLNIDRKISVN